jgi:hypothetical protein
MTHRQVVAEIKSEARKGANLALKDRAREEIEYYLNHNRRLMTTKHTRQVQGEFLVRQYTQTAAGVEIAKWNWEDAKSLDEAVQHARARVDDLLFNWVVEAMRGNPILDRAIRLVAAYLHEKGEPLPPILHNYLSMIAPLRCRKIGNLSRNASILRAIGWGVVRFGLTPNSVMSIVAEILGMEVDAVRQVFKRHRRQSKSASAREDNRSLQIFRKRLLQLLLRRQLQLSRR